MLGWQSKRPSMTDTVKIHKHCATYHKDFLVAFVDSVIIDHAYNGYTQVAPDTKGDAEPQAGQDGYDVPPWQTKAGTVHHRQLLLLHQLRTSLRW